MYWSIGTSNGFYVGPVGTFSEPSDFIERPRTSGQMTPFDTGGLHYGHIATSPPLNAGEHADYVRDNTVSLRGWRSTVLNAITHFWGGDPLKYVDGECPAEGLTTRSHAVDSNRAPAWLWEARLPLTADYEAAIEVRQLFWRRQEGTIFERYLNTSSTLSTSQAERLAALTDSLAVVCDDPLLEMRQKLRTEAPTWP